MNDGKELEVVFRFGCSDLSFLADVPDSEGMSAEEIETLIKENGSDKPMEHRFMELLSLRALASLDPYAYAVRDHGERFPYHVLRSLSVESVTQGIGPTGEMQFAVHKAVSRARQAQTKGVGEVCEYSFHLDCEDELYGKDGKTVSHHLSEKLATPAMETDDPFVYAISDHRKLFPNHFLKMIAVTGAKTLSKSELRRDPVVEGKIVYHGGEIKK